MKKFFYCALLLRRGELAEQVADEVEVVLGDVEHDRQVVAAH